MHLLDPGLLELLDRVELLRGLDLLDRDRFGQGRQILVHPPERRRKLLRLAGPHRVQSPRGFGRQGLPRLTKRRNPQKEKR